MTNPIGLSFIRIALATLNSNKTPFEVKGHNKKLFILYYMLHALENVVRPYLLQLGRSHVGNCPRMYCFMLLCFCVCFFVCFFFVCFVFCFFLYSINAKSASHHFMS